VTVLIGMIFLCSLAVAVSGLQPSGGCPPLMARPSRARVGLIDRGVSGLRGFLSVGVRCTILRSFTSPSPLIAGGAPLRHATDLGR
jgi:hypothetical protein